jgi:hypothetical protein
MVFRASTEDGKALTFQFDTTPPPESEALSKHKRTNADVTKQIAHELTTLPNFVAQVRIAMGARFVEY